MAIEFERILCNIDPKFRVENKQDTDTILYFLNAAVNLFVKTRYYGTNVKGESFEQSQKRIDDLRKVVVDETIFIGLAITGITKASPGLVTMADTGDLQNGDKVLIKNVASMTEVNDETEHTVADLVADTSFTIEDTSNYAAAGTGGYAYLQATRFNTFKAELPDRYWFALLEQVKFDYVHNSSYLNKIRGVVETTSDRFEFALQDPYSEHIFHYEEAEPLRLFVGEDVEFTTDGNYFIREYLLKYIRRPLVLAFTETAIAAGTHKLIPGVLYLVVTKPITHNSIEYVAGETFIAINAAFTTGDEPNVGTVSTVADCDLADHTHDEIVKMAVNLFFEFVGDPRLQNKEAETSKIE